MSGGEQNEISLVRNIEVPSTLPNQMRLPFEGSLEFQVSPATIQVPTSCCSANKMIISKIVFLTRYQKLFSNKGKCI